MYSKITLVVLFVVLIFVTRGAWGVHQKAQIAISEKEIAARELQETNLRTIEITASLERLKSEKGTEEEIRQKLGAALSNEEVVVIVDDKAKKGENSGVVEKSFWQRIVSIFGF